MDRSSDFHDSDVLRLMTAALDSVVGACAHAQTDIEKLRFTATRHILACVGAGERDGERLAGATLDHVRSQDFGSARLSDSAQWPCAHRNSA
jgi:hypothetical protein